MTTSKTCRITQADIGVSTTAANKKTGMTFDELQVQSLSARPEKRKP